MIPGLSSRSALRSTQPAQLRTQLSNSARNRRLRSRLSRQAHLLLPRLIRRLRATGAISARRSNGTGRTTPSQTPLVLVARRGRVCRHDIESDAARVHGRQGLRENMGHNELESESSERLR